VIRRAFPAEGTKEKKQKKNRHKLFSGKKFAADSLRAATGRREIRKSKKALDSGLDDAGKYTLCSLCKCKKQLCGTENVRVKTVRDGGPAATAPTGLYGSRLVCNDVRPIAVATTRKIS